jgi:mono/diheme cytochrome c family protein
MKRAAAGIALGAALLSASPAVADGDARKGRDVAVKHCTRCHVVGDANPYGGIGSTPSFQLLAKRDDWHERFQTFYQRPPHPPFVRVPGVPPPTDLPPTAAPVKITEQQIEDIIAFVRTLRPK